jgi:hypothetical protein
VLAKLQRLSNRRDSPRFAENAPQKKADLSQKFRGFQGYRSQINLLSSRHG